MPSFVVPCTQSGVQSLTWPVPVPSADFFVQFDQVISRAPRLASPQAMITLIGLNFALAQLLISSGRLALASAAPTPSARTAAITTNTAFTTHTLSPHSGGVSESRGVTGARMQG